jgi:hypothetical protein
VKLRITGLLPAVVPPPDVVLDDDDPLEEPELLVVLPPVVLPPVVLPPLLLPPLLLPPLLLEPLLEELDPLPPDDPLEEDLEDDPALELPLFDLLLLLLFDLVVCWSLLPPEPFEPPLPPWPLLKEPEPLVPCPDPEPLLPLCPVVPPVADEPPTVPISASTSHRTMVFEPLSRVPFSTTYSARSPSSTSTS